MVPTLLAFLILPSLAQGQGLIEKGSPEAAVLKAAVFHRAARPAAREPWALRVLTYNVHGIAPTLAQPDPDAAPSPEALSRYREIARRLREARASGSGPQLVAIQEAWHGLAARTATEAGYPYVVKGAGARLGKVAGAGIYILSDYPVFVEETIDYKQCTGWDCLANKGALHVRVVVPELARTLDVYTTHMNADQDSVKPEDSRGARMEQIKDFAAFVKRTRDPGAPAVITGDFNFSYPAEDAALFETLVGASNAEKDCAVSGVCTGDDPRAILRDSVDHQFHLAGRGGWLKAGHVAQTFKEPHEGKPLSDHLGLEARYLLVRPSQP